MAGNERRAISPPQQIIVAAAIVGLAKDIQQKRDILIGHDDAISLDQPIWILPGPLEIPFHFRGRKVG